MHFSGCIKVCRSCVRHGDKVQGVFNAHSRSIDDRGHGAGVGRLPANGKAAANAPDVTREALLGTWQTSVDGGSCQIALSLTQWSGGYRAASLRCPGPAAAIAAWDVTGNQVVLNDRDGNTVARLYKAGDQSYQGRLSAGGSIGLSR